MSPHSYLANLSPQEQVAFAASYPFEQWERSFLYAGGRAYPLVAFDTQEFAAAVAEEGGAAVGLSDLLSPKQRADLFIERVPVIAVGSNASPAQLARKYRDTDDVVPTIRAELADHSVVYAAHITGYGSLPATLHHTPGARVRVFVNYLTPSQRERMDLTEVLGHHYAYTILRTPDLTLENGERPTNTAAYIAIQGVIGRDDGALSLAAIPHPRPVLAAESERGALDYIRSRLAPEADFDRFVLEQIRNPETRKHREDQLKGLSLPTCVAEHLI